MAYKMLYNNTRTHPKPKDEDRFPPGSGGGLIFKSGTLCSASYCGGGVGSRSTFGWSLAAEKGDL